MIVKCLVTGDVNGRFIEVFKKIEILHAKQAFTIAIIVGNLFADETINHESKTKDLDNLLSGSLKLPIPTYFSLGRTAFPAAVVQRLANNHDEICENLIFLGKRTTMRTSEGVRIIALGGTYDREKTAVALEDRYSPTYSTADAQILRRVDSADILVTTEWPKGVLIGSQAAAKEGTTEQEVTADLCTIIKPRYHFTASSSYIEREPFFHPQPADDTSKGYNVTRFIALAPYGNATKQKWIYAFSIEPSAILPLVIPPGTTASPFLFKRKRALSTHSAVEAFSRFSTVTTDTLPPKRSKHRQPPPGPESCFFCLSNPDTATHLITSIGDDAYMTTAKGPLSTSSSFAEHGLDFPGHLLIIPLPHIPTLGAIREHEVRSSTIAEMRRFRARVFSALWATTKGRLGAVSWEVNRSQGIHAHWQMLPLPVGLVAKGLVEAAFKVEAENEGYPAFQKADDCWAEADDYEGDYFRVWIAGDCGQTDGGEATPSVLTLPLGPDFRFDLQFGRRVLAKLLGLDKRFNWRQCEQSAQQEAADVEAWKRFFTGFDFSLE